MIGKSLGRVSRPPRSAVPAAKFPHGHPIRGHQLVPRFRPAAECGDFPCRCSPFVPVDSEERPPFDASVNDLPSPEALGGKTPAPPANYRPHFRRDSGKLTRLRWLPEPRAWPGRRMPRTRSDRPEPIPSRVGFHPRNPFPNGLRDGPSSVWFEGGVYARRWPDREGQHLQFPGDCWRRLAGSGAAR